MQYLFSDQGWKIRIASARRIFLFLDFDGTLSPIVKRPSQARILPGIKIALSTLCRRRGIVIVVISGRSRQDLAKRVGIKGIAYIGWHGLDAGFRPPPSFLKALSRIKAEIRKRRSLCPRLEKEDKGIILALHYRNLSREESRCWQDVKEIIKRFAAAGSIKIGRGKKVLEVRPPREFSKGLAVKRVFKRRRRSQEDIAIYIGDDLTDEDGFRALAETDLAVRIGRKQNSAAPYFLRRAQEVEKILDYLLSLKRE